MQTIVVMKMFIVCEFQCWLIYLMHLFARNVKSMWSVPKRLSLNFIRKRNSLSRKKSAKKVYLNFLRESFNRSRAISFIDGIATTVQRYRVCARARIEKISHIFFSFEKPKGLPIILAFLFVALQLFQWWSSCRWPFYYHEKQFILLVFSLISIQSLCHDDLMHVL